jgi:hypothetical protein
MRPQPEPPTVAAVVVAVRLAIITQLLAVLAAPA